MKRHILRFAIVGDILLYLPNLTMGDKVDSNGSMRHHNGLDVFTFCLQDRGS